MSVRNSETSRRTARFQGLWAREDGGSRAVPARNFGAGGCVVATRPNREDALMSRRRDAESRRAMRGSKKHRDARIVEMRGADAFRSLLSGWTVRVVGLNDRDKPVNGWGSGLLWHRGSKLTLLSVYHNFLGGRRFVDAGLHDGRRAVLLRVGEPGWISEATLRGEDVTEVRDTDFAWAHLDIEALKQAMPPALKDSTIPVYRGTFEAPSESRAYGFAAWIGDWYHRDSTELGMRLAHELYMKFDGVQPDGPWAGSHRFLLARRHQGDKYYKGSSGSPIADEQGRIVALVRSGDEAGGVIFGCPLQQFTRYVEL